MEYYKKLENMNSKVDFELDLTSDNKIRYIKDQDQKMINQNIISDIDIIIKLIEIGALLSAFFILYGIIKLNNKYKKIQSNKNVNLRKLYDTKIYKKKKILNNIENDIYKW